MQKESNKQEAKLQSARSKLDKELTGDKDADTVVTTPQSQWTPFQIAVANLNPELKQRNKRYQSALNSLNILNNEKVNLWEAGQIMMNAYKEAMNKTEDAAQNQMLANSVSNNIQASWAISWLAWLATNPWAAAMQRMAAQNQAATQNAQVRSNADQNIASVYNNAAQVPATIWSLSQINAGIDQANAQIEANNRQLDIQEKQAEASNNLANAQADYYRNQPSTTYVSRWTSSNDNDNEDVTKYYWEYEVKDGQGNSHKIKISKDWYFYDGVAKKNSNNIAQMISIAKQQIENEPALWTGISL